MSDDERTDPLEPSAGDLAHRIVKTTLSHVPVVGGVASELFAYLVAEPAARRRDEWVQGLEARLRQIEEQVPGFSVQHLKDNEEFVTVLLAASQQAMRTHDRAKLDALKNAVVNTALDVESDDEVRTLMLVLIERLSPLHLRLLSAFQNPTSNPSLAGRSPRTMKVPFSQFVCMVAPDLNAHSNLISHLWNDLAANGLLVPMSTEGFTVYNLHSKMTTSLGDRLLRFIVEHNGGESVMKNR